MAQPPPLTPYWNDSQTVLLRKILTNSAMIADALSGGGGGGSVAIFVTPPSAASDPGSPGQVAEDGSYFYVYSATFSQWLRVPISDW